MAVFPLTRQQHQIQKTDQTLRRWIPLLRLLLAPIIGVLLVLGWKWLAESGRYPAFILPHPDAVVARLEFLYERGLLEEHLKVTARAALTGLCLSIGLALPLGYLVARSKWVSALLMPYLVAIRAVPVVAIAALIVIWLGTDLKSKVFVVTFITWFPLMEATVVGIQSVDTNLRDLMRSYQANPLQVFWKLELPAAMPNILSGLKVSATLSVVGAAVGELIGGSKGLAYLILYGRGISDAPMVFGAVLMLTLLSLILYAIVAIAEHLLLRWRTV